MVYIKGIAFSKPVRTLKRGGLFECGVVLNYASGIVKQVHDLENDIAFRSISDSFV